VNSLKQPRKSADPAPRPVLYTIGHSTHPIETFLRLLAQHQIDTVADVRSFPSSRRWPQFNHSDLQRSVERAGMDYQWLKALGGRRNLKRPDSPHTAWRIPAFRGYADYTETAGFAAGLSELIEIASAGAVAIMCSEGLWWRCHRRIISDHMVVRGWIVQHIMPDGKLVAHELADFASVRDGQITYDGGQTALNLD
jgi:uncharacterized protein (DUF488 family)